MVVHQVFNPTESDVQISSRESTRSRMKTEYYEEPGCVTVKVSGRIDTLTAPEFGRVLKGLLNKKPAACLIDMNDVVFLSSAGLQTLLAGAKISQQIETYFAVFGLRDTARDVFTLSGFNRFIQSFSSKEEALRQC